MLDALTLDQLRIFVSAVDEGSFSAAARKLGRVQSAVSQSVAALEGHLGVALFDRSSKTPRLTPAGVALAKDARRLLKGADALKARAASIAAEIEPDLVFAVDAIFPHEPLIASLKALRDAFPLLPVSIFTETPRRLGAAAARRRGAVRHLSDAAARRRRRPRGRLSRPDRRRSPSSASTTLWRRSPSPITREALEPHVQLVLTDRTPLTQNFRAAWSATTSGGSPICRPGSNSCSPASAGARCPLHLVRAPIAEGRLKALVIAERDPFQFRAACRAGARPRNRPRGTLAHRGFAGADGRLRRVGSVPDCPGGAQDWFKAIRIPTCVRF